MHLTLVGSPLHVHIFPFNVQYYFVVVSFIWHDPRMLIAHSGVRAVAGHALHQRTSALVLV